MGFSWNMSLDCRYMNSLNVCSTFQFILIRKRTCTRGQCLVLLVHGFPHFLMKLLNVSDNYTKFIPVELWYLGEWTVSTRLYTTRALKLVCPLLHWFYLWLSSSCIFLFVMSAIASRKKVYKRFLRWSGIIKFLTLGVQVVLKPETYF